LGGNKNYSYTIHQSHSEKITISGKDYSPASRSTLLEKFGFNFVGIAANENFISKCSINYMKQNNLYNDINKKDFIIDRRNDLINHLQNSNNILIKIGLYEAIEPINDAIKYCNPNNNNIFFQKTIEIHYELSKKYPNIKISPDIIYVQYKNLSINKKIEYYYQYCHKVGIQPMSIDSIMETYQQLYDNNNDIE
jgi:hypothetical protein